MLVNRGGDVADGAVDKRKTFGAYNSEGLLAL